MPGWCVPPSDTSAVCTDSVFPGSGRRPADQRETSRVGIASVTCIQHNQAGTELSVESLAYGYLRVTDLAGDKIWQLEWSLRKLAKAKGFCLLDIVSDSRPGDYGRFYRLIGELKRTQIRHVLVPSLDHLSSHPLLCEQLLLRLDEVGARVWLVEP
jgi:hypothetical protein